MPFPTEEEIKQRNSQYRKLEMSRNKKRTYRLETFENNQWQDRMFTDDKEYLSNVGRKWKKQGMCADFRVTEFA